MHTTGIILSALKQILRTLGHRESGSDIHICLFVLQLGEGWREEGTMLVLAVTTEVLLLQNLMMVRGMVMSPSLQMVECTPSDQVSLA